MKTNYSKTMFERWHKTNFVLPQADINDIIEQCVDVNQGNNK